eukprot:Skav223723  [mRNA]  locus=scaffold2564:197614:200452:- [translate_table: standard]
MEKRRKLEPLLQQIKALDDDDLDAAIAAAQEEKALRQLPPVEVTFQSITGEELLEPCALALHQLHWWISLVKLQDNLMKPSDLVASLGKAAVLSVVQSHPAIEVKGELKGWPNVWIARPWDSEISGSDVRCRSDSFEEFLVVKATASAALPAEEPLLRHGSSLWRRMPRSSMLTAAAQSMLNSIRFGAVTVALEVPSAVEVALLADMLETGRIFYRLKDELVGDGEAEEALRPWSNAKQCHCAVEVDTVILWVNGSQGIVASLEPYRSFCHDKSKVLLFVTEDAGGSPEALYNDCVQQLRAAGWLKPLEQVTLNPYFERSAAIVAGLRKPKT